MTHTRIWAGLRAILSVTLAITAWVVAMLFTSLFPGVDAGKFLSDFGFTVAAACFLLLLLAATFLARLRWWDCALPVIIPLYIVGFDLTNYWTRRVWLAFILPIALSAASAALFRHGKRVA